MSIVIENLFHIYDAGSPYQTAAINGVSLTLEEGRMIGLIGHTGSGKSTLIQHLNGLIKPTKGRILVDETDLTARSVRLDAIRKKVGLVFQYPEYQLFEETIAKDVAFGPKQLGLRDDEVDRRVREALQTVGLPYEKFAERSPFELSGGQRRRAAIAGVLAMEPKYLILDEPTAGLDPRGRDEVLGQISRLQKERGITVILVTHSMEDIARLVERILVMDKGTVVLDGSPAEVFRRGDDLRRIGLGVPQVTELALRLQEKGMLTGQDIYTVEQAHDALLQYYRGKRPC